MGSTGVFLPPSVKTREQFFHAELEHDFLVGDIINHAVNGTTIYIAFRTNEWGPNLDDLPDAARDLVDACLAEPNPANVPWHLFRNASHWDCPADYFDAEAQVVEGDGGMRYEVEMRHTLTQTRASWQIQTQIGFGWQDMWALTIEFILPDGATDADIKAAFEQHYPDYML